MKPIIYTVRDHNCVCSENYVRIEDSYNVKTSEIRAFLSDLVLQITLDGKLKYKRSFESWEKEWVAHNRLYKLGLFRQHTKDADLYEDESKFRLFCYNIIGFHL